MEVQLKDSGRYYRPELDALRFFAFLCVFNYHRMDYVRLDPVKDLWAYRIGIVGAFGVPVFFLLSAFLITELLFREQERTGKIHIRSFYMRRILRIWPLYFVMFFGLALLNHFVPGTGTDDPHAWLAFSGFAGNWYITRHGWIAGSVDPLWSISVEEQFYIVVPMLAGYGGRRTLYGVSSVLLAVAYVTVMLYALRAAPGDQGEWTNSFVQFQFFCAGTLIALVLRGRLITLSLTSRVAGFVLGFLCWLTATLQFKVQSWDPQPTPAGSILGWALVLAGSVLFFLSTLGLKPQFVPGWLAYFGRISYGLYLVHSLVFFLTFEKAMPRLERLMPRADGMPWLRDGVGTLFVLGVSLGLAHLSFRYFEGYFLRLKRRFTLVPARD